MEVNPEVIGQDLIWYSETMAKLDVQMAKLDVQMAQLDVQMTEVDMVNPERIDQDLIWYKKAMAKLDDQQTKIDKILDYSKSGHLRSIFYSTTCIHTFDF